MADTFIASRQQNRFVTDKIMYALFNGSGSGVVLKVYRIWVRNIQLTAITGIPIIMEIKSISAASGGIPAQLNRMSTATATLPSQVVIGEDMTVTEGAIRRRFTWSTDEPQIGVGSIDEIQLQRPYVTMIDFNQNDSNIQPWTLREGEGICLKNITTTTIGYCNISCEFTAE